MLLCDQARAMAVRRRTLCLAFMVLTAQCSSVSSNRHCATFIFPTLTSNKLTTAVNTSLSLPFQLQQRNCAAQNFVLTVARRDSTGRLGYQCKLLHTDGKCDALTQQVCYCLKEPGQYKFSKTAEVADDGTWVWMVGEGLAEEKTIIFQIARSPSITRLTLAGYQDSLPRPATPNGKVDVVCTWDAGNPPVAAHLLDRHGAILQTVSDALGEIRYRFVDVGCQDAGLIRCQAPGAGHNKTATLLVTCPPAISFTAARDAEAIFHVRMHTMDITSCRVAKIMSANSQTSPAEQSKDCSSALTVTGSPPDLTVSVRLDSVRTQEQGIWRLTLTNDVGDGHVDFHLAVDETAPGTEMPAPDDGSNRTHTGGDDSSSSGGPSVTVLSIAGVNVATVIIVAIVVLIIVSVRRSRRVPRPAEAPELHDVLLPGQVAQRRPSNPDGEESHIYEVMPDAAEAAKDYTSLKAQHRRPAPELPEDYLHPATVQIPKVK